MDSMSLLKTYNFITECNKNINEFKKNSIESLDLIKEGVEFNFLPPIKNFIPEGYISSQLGVLDAVADRIPELEDFFSSIYSNTDFEKSPSATTPVFDVNEIKEFKPQYLTQFVSHIGKLIQSVINEKKSDLHIEELSNSNKILISLKKSLVSSNLPDYVKDKDFIKFDNKIVVPVNSSYIQTTLLPFLRGFDIEYNSIKKTAVLLISTIDNNIKTLTSYSETLNELSNKNKISDEQTLYKLTYIAYSIFLEASKYMLGCFMRKVYIYTSNIKEYGVLKDQLMLSFNNGADVLHESVFESVLDGSYEFRDEDVVINMLDGRCDLTDSIIDRIYTKFKDYLLELRGRKIGDSLHSLIDVEIENSGFDLSLYKNMLEMEGKLASSLEKLVVLSRDCVLSLDEILKDCGLTDKLHHTYSEMFDEITDVSMYINDQKYDTCLSILNELRYGKKFMAKFSNNMEGIYAVFSDLKKDISINDNDEFENHERNNDEMTFLDSFDKDLRQFILDLSRSYISRLRNIEDILISNDSSLSSIDPAPEDLEQTDDYLCRALEENLDIDYGYNESVISNSCDKVARNILYRKTKSPMISLFTEVTNNNQNSNNGNSNNQNGGNSNASNNSGNSTNSNNNSTKPVVTDNSNNGNNNQNSNNGNNNGTNTFKNIADKVSSFINDIVSKISDQIQSLVNNGHLEFIKNNKDALLKRSYSNVQISILRYTDIDYIKIINDCKTQLQSFKGNPSIIQDKNIDNMMFKSIPMANIDTSLKTNEKINIALKSNTGKLEVVNIANGELGELIPKMISYCEDYYNNFGNNLKSAINDLNETLNQISQNTSSNNSNNSNGDETFKILQHIGTNINTLTGVIANVARDREKDYYSVLKSLAPSKKETKNNNNTSNNNNNNNTSNNNENTDNNSNNNENNNK